jgi:citrate synthase
MGGRLYAPARVDPIGYRPRRTEPERSVVSDFKPGLEGVVAFETEIAEPDRDGGALRYRGVDIEDLVGVVTFEKVWGLLVDGSPEPGLGPAEPYEAKDLTGNAPDDLQSVTARLSAEWGLGQLIDISDEQATDDLRRLSATMISVVAQSARVADGQVARVPARTVAEGATTAERFLLEWRGEADPRHVAAIDTYWICTAEHGMNASTFTARVVASTGADCGACLSSAVGALSGPLHGGAPARVLPMLDAAAAADDVDAYVKGLLDRGERLMGFGHRVYRAEDPRARLLRRTARALGSARFEVAEELERVALAELLARKPDRVLATNVEFWSAVVLDVADVPPRLAPAMFGCSRTAGWSAHVIEQKRLGRLVRPSARYVGPGPRPLPA